MKHLLFLSILFFSISASGQNSLKSKSDKKHSRIQMGANFLAEYSNRWLKNSTGSSYHDYIIGERNIDEYGKSGFSTGVNVCIGLSKFLSLETGIQYANRGYRTKTIPTDGFHSLIFEPIVTSNKYIYTYRYLDIPLKINFIYGQEKIRFIGSLGMSANLFVNEKEKHIEFYDDYSTKVINTISKDKSMTKIGFTPMIAAGFDYALSKKTNLRMQSTYRKSIKTLIQDPVYIYLYGVGVNVGYYYTVN